MVIEALTKENFQDEVEECVGKKDWKKIIKLSQKYGFETSSLFYWVFPSEYCLEQLKVTFKKFNISLVLSVGCGEWKSDIKTFSMKVKIKTLKRSDVKIYLE